MVRMRITYAIMNKIEGHYTLGFGDGSITPLAPIRLLPGVGDQAREFMHTRPDPHAIALQKLVALIDGFESPYGLELLGTIHWVVAQEGVNPEDTDAVIAAVQEWNPRKKRVMQTQHITIALNRLRSQQWV